MQPKLDDIGGARELAMHRLTVAKDDLTAAEQSFEGKHYRASNNRLISVEDAKEHLETAREVVDMVAKYLDSLE